MFKVAPNCTCTLLLNRFGILFSNFVNSSVKIWQFKFFRFEISLVTFIARTLGNAILVQPLFTITKNVKWSYFICASCPLASASQTVLRVKFSAHFVFNCPSFGELKLKNVLIFIAKKIVFQFLFRTVRTLWKKNKYVEFRFFAVTSRVYTILSRNLERKCHCTRRLN